MKKIKYFFEFLPIVVIDKIFQVLPRSLALKTGRGIGRFLSHLFQSRFNLILKNLKFAFPGMTLNERKKIAQDVWINLGQVAAEFVLMKQITKSNFRDYFDVVNEHLVHQAKQENKGIIFIGCHFSNWEMSGVGGSFVHEDIVAIARPIKNPFVQNWVQSKRAEGKIDIILHRQAVKASLKALSKNRGVGILIDQHLYKGGEIVPFFGRPAATTTLPALLYSRTKSPMLHLYTRRKENKMELVFEKPKGIPEFRKDASWIKEATAALNKNLEEIISRQPQHWFWVHNRWKIPS